MDRASTSDGLRMFKSMVNMKKTEIWDQVREKSRFSKSHDAVHELTIYLQTVKQEFLKFGLDHEIDQYELTCASELIFPACERKLVTLVVKPFFMSHFVIWRLDKIAHGSQLERKVRLSQTYYTAEQKLEYRQYLTDFLILLNEFKNGVFNVNIHLEPIISALCREIAAGYIKHEANSSDNEIKCTWFQDLISALRHWSIELQLVNAFEYSLISIHKDVIRTLTQHIYKIVIVDFPARYRTIFTLRYCLQNTHNYGRDNLTKNLISDIEKNLLLASVDTKIILNAYASCVESLRELDTTCVVMHRVCSVIKEYLKKRPDTVQQIITYITSEKKEELEKDMTNTKRSAMMDEDELKGVNDEFLPENMDSTGWFEWDPHPVDAAIGEGTQGRQGVDVFNMLVSVYGSKEMFVKEYRSLLADRLSNSDRKDWQFELRYLDLLKLRFQYSELQHCEVMLRDVRQSGYVDERMLTENTVPISTCVISSHYWPKIECDKTEVPMPEALVAAQKLYETIFANVRQDRKLKWMSGVGCVEVIIELDGAKIEKTVPNTFASVLYLLLEKETWTVAEVAESLGIAGNIAKRRLEWWAKQGILISSVAAGTTSEIWSLTKSSSTISKSRAKSPELVDEDDSILDDGADMVESLEQYWTYTLNYIGNHAANGEVKAERMHRVYRMFGSPTSAGPTLEHVNTFLQRKVQLGYLKYSNGQYRVVQKS